MQINTLFLVGLLFITLTQSSFTEQPINFDYKSHGTDWPDSCINTSLHNQSPINLPRQITSDKGSYLFTDFKKTNSTGKRYNTTFVITPSNQDDRFGQLYTQLIKQAHYSFKATQIRIRYKSQHRIQNKQYDLQVQIHTFPLIGKQNDKLIIGLLFQANQTSQDDPFLAQIVKNSKGLNQQFSLNVDLSYLLYRQEIFNFWFYLGSITYPTCRNKGMNWIIPDKIFSMSQTQVNFFKQFWQQTNGNWRDIQADTGNEIGYATVLPSATIKRDNIEL